MMLPQGRRHLVRPDTDDASCTDFFCGIGGSSSGLRRAGWRVDLAANHSQRAIITHSANHPDTEHLCADLQNIDLRRLPRTKLLWASPICTEVSPAGGRRRKGHQADKLERDGHVGNDSLVRTRVTFWEVLRAAELHRYLAVIIENVVEAADWELFTVWLSGMTMLGYNHQFVSVSAAHVGDEGENPRAPQWRDRMYIVFTQVGIPLPDVDPRPLAWCPTCELDVEARQWWKKAGPRIGKYGPQYFYVCPNETSKCKLTRVEPYALPAAAAIDWTDLGQRIGDMPLKKITDKKTGEVYHSQLARPTFRRIGVGLDTIGNPALVAGRNHGLTIPAPFIVKQFGGALQADATRALKGVDEPLPPAVGTSRPQLVTPPGAFVSKHHGGMDYPRPEHMNKPVDTQPMPSMVARVNTSLVIPYRKGSKPHRAIDRPLSTMSTVDTHSLLTPAEPVDVMDCYFRMLNPREAANAQRFTPDYILTGTKGEQQLGAGNAVPCNVAQWLGTAVMAVL